MEKQLFIIKEKETGKIFKVYTKKFEVPDEEDLCTNCGMMKYCANKTPGAQDKYEVYDYNPDDNYPRIVVSIELCEQYNDWDSCFKVYRTTECKKLEFPLVKILQDDLYGDEKGKVNSWYEVGHVLLPNDIIENFCKKTCPMWNGKDFKCMKQIGCPFKDFLIECYNIL